MRLLIFLTSKEANIFHSFFSSTTLCFERDQWSLDTNSSIVCFSVCD